MSRRTKSIINRDQARHIKYRIQPQRETPQALPRHHTQSEERDLGSRPEFASNPEERTPSLIPGEHPNLREKLQDQAFPRSSQHGSMRIHVFTGSSSAPGCPAFQTTPLFQWRQLQMAADIPACQYQQSSAAIRTVIERFQKKSCRYEDPQDQRHQLHFFRVFISLEILDGKEPNQTREDRTNLYLKIVNKGILH